MTALEIRPLLPELARDYFDFFETRAFTDDAPWRCYCQIWHETAAERESVPEGLSEAGLGDLARRSAAEQIASGVLRGYLAYDGGRAVAWCHADDRSRFPADSACGPHLHAPPEAREMAVVCFEIAPEYRGKGLATALLERVIADARAGGYRAVVAFPVERAERFTWDFTGPVRLYEKAGFTVASRDGESLVVRLKL